MRDKMKESWQALNETLWPSRGVGSGSQSRRMASLQVMLALSITLACGPEIFAAMELTALLEILGASLFVTAYAAGFKLKALELCRALQSTVSPVGQFDVMRSSAAPVRFRAIAAVSAMLNVVWCVAAVVVLAAYGQHLCMQVA